jgi:hypothetical protein
MHEASNKGRDRRGFPQSKVKEWVNYGQKINSLFDRRVLEYVNKQEGA